jgi:hypothetical protein
MCTASWWFAEDGGYELFFNRDELKRRAAGLPPEEFCRDGMRYLAPRDGERGGTWLAINEHGLTVCLINHYPAPRHTATTPAPTPRLSRGELVLRCATANTPCAVETLVRGTQLEDYAPFFLLTLAAEKTDPTRLLTWDGNTLETLAGEAVTTPVTSSSFETECVIAARHETFGDLGATAGHAMPARLQTYHQQHDTTRGAYSVCMNRPDACTVSFTRVCVTPRNVTLRYEPVSWSATSERLAGEIVTVQLLRHRAQLPPDTAPGLTVATDPTASVVTTARP